MGDEVHISRSLGSTGEVTLPKNGHARRVVLPPEAKEALASMPSRADSPYVFTTPSGKRFSKTAHYYYYYWRLLRAEAGRPKMAYYELRHFAATLLLELGCSPADVAVQLGRAPALGTAAASSPPWPWDTLRPWAARPNRRQPGVPGTTRTWRAAWSPSLS